MDTVGNRLPTVTGRLRINHDTKSVVPNFFQIKTSGSEFVLVETSWGDIF